VHRDNAIGVILFLLSAILVLIQLETELCSSVFANVSVEADVLRQIVGSCLGRVLGQALRVVDAYEGSFPILIPLARFMLRHANQLASLSEVSSQELFCQPLFEPFRMLANLHNSLPCNLPYFVNLSNSSRNTGNGWPMTKLGVDLCPRMEMLFNLNAADSFISSPTLQGTSSQQWDREFAEDIGPTTKIAQSTDPKSRLSR
jgi:hypothetical protein